MEGTNEYELMWGMVLNGKPSPSEDLKATRKHFSRLGLIFFLGAVIINGMQLAAAVVVGIVKPEWLADPNAVILLSVLPTYLIGMPAMIALAKRVPSATVEEHHMKAGDVALAAFMCFAIVYVSNIIGNMITFVIGLMKGGEVENVLAGMTDSVELPLLFLTTVICAPLAEEYIFRKLIVDRTVRYGQGVAVVTSGLMFGLFHGNLNQFAYAFTLGMFLAFLYVKTGNLKITIAFHMMVNFMGTVAITLLTDTLHLDDFLEALDTDAGGGALLRYYLENLTGWAIYFAFVFFVLAVIIVGSVLLIIAFVKRRFLLESGEITIPEGKRFKTIFLNPGMILFGLFWIAIILWQLLY